MIRFKKNSPIIVLIGKSATGKDTIKNKIINENNFHSSISYTTRPARDGEKNGKEYFFVNKKEFDSLKERNQILEHTEYNVCGKLFEYGLGVDSFVNDIPNIVIVNPIGLKQLVEFEEIKERLFIVQTILPDDEIKKRYFEREKSSNVKDLKARYEARKLRDDEDFKDLNDIIAKYHLKNITVENFDTDETVQKILQSFYETFLLNRRVKVLNLSSIDSFKREKGLVIKINNEESLITDWENSNINIDLNPVIDEIEVE